MSRRGWVLFLLGCTYGSLVGGLAAFTGTVVADWLVDPVAPGSSLLAGMASFLCAAAIVAALAMLPAGKLMWAYMDFWNARWDENGEPWPVRQTEPEGEQP